MSPYETEKSVSEQYESALPEGELVLGQLTALNQQEATVTFNVNGKVYRLPALYTTALASAHIGRQVVLSFIKGDIKQPLILGVLHSALFDLLEDFEMSAVDKRALENYASDTPAKEAAVTADGKNVTIHAEHQLQLKCGESSITLTRDGKIQIRGKYLINRASGVNRIIGGSVQVN